MKEGVGMCNNLTTCAHSVDIVQDESKKNEKIEQNKESAKLVKLASDALVKIDNATLDFDSEFAKFSKKEMDIAFILFAAFSSLDTVTLNANDDVRKAIVLQNQHIKELCGLYTKTRRITKKDYQAYIKKVKIFFRRAEFYVHFVIKDDSGKEHIVTGTTPIFGPILEVDDGEAILVTLDPKANNVFSNFLPKVSFSKFLLKKFLDLKSVYSKILFYKLINYKRRYGWTVDVEDLKKDFNLSTKTRLNNFYVRLNEYINDVLETGYFEAITPIFHRKKEGINNSPVVSIEFIVTPKESAFIAKKQLVQKMPVQVSVVIKRIITSPEMKDGDLIPTLHDTVKYEEKHIICPYCGGNIVHWIDKKNNDCFACANSNYWAEKLNKENEAHCNFFATTANVNTLSQKNLRGIYELIHNWLADNTDRENEKRNIIKEDYGDGYFIYKGKITPAMEQHNEQIRNANKHLKDEMDAPPFPIE